MPLPFLGLKALINKFSPKGLQAEAEKQVRERADEQVARTAAKQLARSIYKTIGAAMHPNTGLDVAARVSLGEALAEQAALQAAQVPAAIRGYAAAQAALERARGTAGEDAARKWREEAENLLNAELVDISRAVNGDAPQA